MKKKIIGMLLVAAMTFTGSMFGENVITANATQTRAYYFNRNYMLTRYGMDDIVAVAMLQVGKNKTDLHYSESWCADFVSDCAMIAGVSDVIPLNGKVRDLYKGVISHGGKEVTLPQKGDLVFYYCNTCSGHWMHVGIMTDSNQSVEGNYSGKVSLVKGIYRDINGHTLASGVVVRHFVRPDYDSSMHIVPKIIKPAENATNENAGAPDTSVADNKHGTGSPDKTENQDKKDSQDKTADKDKKDGQDKPDSNNKSSDQKKDTKSQTKEEKKNDKAKANKSDKKTTKNTNKKKKFTKKKAGNYKVVTKDTPLTVRSKPDKTSDILGSVAKGSVVRVKKTNGSWALISYKGNKGYLSMDYLKKISKKK